MEAVGQAAAVAQLVGSTGTVGLIQRIIRATETARQNKQECQHLALRVSVIWELLPRLPLEPWLESPLKELGKTLGEAHKLILACQKRSTAGTLLNASRDAHTFRELNASIDSLLGLFPLIVASRLGRILPPDNRDGESITLTGPPPSSSYGSLQTQPYEDGESSQPWETVINTLLSSREMSDQVMELKALKGVLIDANAEPIRLSYPFLSSITGDFSREIGRGGFGIVYQGDIGTSKVAVKKLFISESFSDTLFVDEIKCLLRAKHNNVVRFLGYCADTHGKLASFNGNHVMSELPHRLLCFEYVPNGDLRKYLKDESHKDEWKIRYQMIRGICRGLNYLHGQRVNHLDLKPANILLDACMEPKIADFGLSRCFDEGISRVHTKVVRGTVGCIAPETINNGEITFKSDIYGLGIIIIKLLTRCNNCDFENWLTSLDMDHPRVKSLAEIAQTCVQMDQHKRPTICEIMQKLDEIESM
uniref:non-specific serine/threonine protein kinase n=1 Tax=Aegilops longissima TaxID=4486 RepID=A0AAT9V5F4_AEGLO